MSNSVKTDVAILGGGIAGIWIMSRLAALGYSVLLFESNGLGGTQTYSAQGMIHGGIKYTLDGALSSASESIAGMPDFWRQCIAGQGSPEDPDLSDVKVLSDAYYLFSDASFSSRLTTFFGSKLVKGRVHPVRKEDFPAAFDSPDFRGRLYRLEDIVIDTRSLIHSLIKPLRQRIFHANAQPIMGADGDVEHLRITVPGTKEEKEITVKADTYIFAAGAGNEALIQMTGSAIQTQKRPLHQVMVSSGLLPPVYAHAFRMRSGSLPRVTISTHQNTLGENVWYLGGEIAESGVDRSEDEQIRFAQQELSSLFPWLDFSTASWQTHRVERAEASTENGDRPDKPVMRNQANMLFCWPVKLTMAPLLGKEVITHFNNRSPRVKTPINPDDLKPLRFPNEANFPWEHNRDEKELSPGC